MSLHTLTLCVKRFMRRIDEEVADAAETHAPTCFGNHALNEESHRHGGHPKVPVPARTVHAAMTGQSSGPEIRV